MDISPDTQSLLEKLDALELTEGERTAFGQLFGVGDDDEVEGFFQKIEVTGQARPKIQGFSIGLGELQECTVSKVSTGSSSMPDD